LTLADTKDLVLELLDQVRAHCGPATEQHVVNDVVCTVPETRRCIAGPVYSTIGRSARSVTNARGCCTGYKCPHCVDYAISRDVLRFLRGWDNPEQIYTRVFTIDEWKRRTNELASFKAEHPYVVVNTTLARVAFSPDPFPGATAVPAAAALVGAILLTPAQGRRRYSRARKVSQHEKAEREAASPDPDVLRTRAPRFHTIATLNQTYREALGRDPGFVTGLHYRGDEYTRSDRAVVEEHELETVVGVWETIRWAWLDETERMRRGKQAQKQMPVWMSEFAASVTVN
jgi:hypothetical protein